MLLLLRLTNFRSPLIPLTMPATRSRSKAAAAGADQHPAPKPPKSGRSHRVVPDDAAEPVVKDRAPPKRTRPEKQPVSAANVQPVEILAAVPNDPGPPPIIVPAELSFSFEEAKQHLLRADTRFQDVFVTAVCTPYQKLDRVEPFRRVPLARTTQSVQETHPFVGHSARPYCESLVLLSPIHAFTRSSVGVSRFLGWLLARYATASFVSTTPLCQRSQLKNRM